MRSDFLHTITTEIGGRGGLQNAIFSCLTVEIYTVHSTND